METPDHVPGPRVSLPSRPKTKPLKNGRKRPDGVQLEWETAQVGPVMEHFFPFLIHDLTPRDLRAILAASPPPPASPAS